MNNYNLSLARDRQIAATVVAAFGAFGALPLALLTVGDGRFGSTGPLTSAGAVVGVAGILACVLPMRRPATAAFCALAATGAMVFVALDTYPSLLGAVLFIPAVEFVISAGLALDAHRLRASAS